MTFAWGGLLSFINIQNNQTVRSLLNDIYRMSFANSVTVSF